MKAYHETIPDEGSFSTSQIGLVDPKKEKQHRFFFIERKFDFNYDMYLAADPTDPLDQLVGLPKPEVRGILEKNPFASPPFKMTSAERRHNLPRYILSNVMVVVLAITRFVFLGGYKNVEY